MIAFMAVIVGLGLLFYLLLGSRYSFNLPGPTDYVEQWPSGRSLRGVGHDFTLLSGGLGN